MPHIIIEHSDNLGPPDIVQTVVDRVHQAALTSPVVGVAGLRTRAAARPQFRVADGHPENGFVAVVARLGPGRSDEEKTALLELLLDAVEAAVVDVAPDLVVSYSVEFQQIDAEFRINRNHIRARLEERNHG